MAAAGYLYSLTVDGTEISFKTVNLRDIVQFIDTSARANPDGTTNTGYSAKDSDLQTITINFNQHVQTPNGLPSVTKGVNDVEWSITYNGVSLYSGSSLFIEEFNYEGAVPGEGRLTCTMYNNGVYN